MRIILSLSLLLLTKLALCQIAHPVPNILVCDDLSNDGLEMFDLSIFNSQILQNQNPASFSVSYHTSLTDASNRLNPLPTNFTNTSNPQDIFYRVESVNNPSNFDTTSFTLSVSTIPVINSYPSNYNFCGITTTGGILADLSQIESVISTGQSDITFSYYLSQQDADLSTNPLPNNQLENPANTQISIFIRAENSANNSCFEIFSTNSTLTECDGLRIQSILDINMNGMVDSTDVPFPLGVFNWEKDSNGNIIEVNTPESAFNIFNTNPASSYNLGYNILPAYAANYTVLPATYTGQTIAAGSGVTTRDFLVMPLTAYEDVVVYIIPQEQPRPGFTYKEKVVYANLGTAPVAMGQLQFIYDSSLSIVAVDEPAAAIGATSVDLNYTNLLPFEYRSMQIEMQIPVIPNINLGDVLTNNATISPATNDITPSNNNSVSTQLVIGSYDPNDKMESRGEFIVPAEFGPNDYFYYTIRFENTGTASAINVRIEDILDAQLDWNSIEMIDASHNYVMERIEQQAIWRFDNILLPDSTTDPVGANGYVYFKIKPLIANEGTVIPNTAEIYFDFNPPIITNMFRTTFQTPLGLDTPDLVNFSMFPNPTTGMVQINLEYGTLNNAHVILYDVSGRIVLSQNLTNNNLQLDVTELPAGIYIAKLFNNENIYVSKVIKE